jgi:hypothetical protein
MDENKHDEGKSPSNPPLTTVVPTQAPAAQPNPATTSPAPAAQSTPTVTPPAAVTPPAFDQRLIHIVEKSQKPDSANSQRPDVVERILEQK